MAITVQLGGQGKNFANADLSFTDDRLHNMVGHSITLGNAGGFKILSVMGGYEFSYRDIGNGRPEFVQDCPPGGETWYRAMFNGTEMYSYVTFSTGQIRVKARGDYQLRDTATNAINWVRNSLGEWVFDFDVLGVTAPETDVRMKIIAASGKIALVTSGQVRHDSLNTYADNATAVAALGLNKLYVRTGHGLDITV